MKTLFPFYFFIIFLLSFFHNSILFSVQDNESRLFQDLLIVDYWNKRLSERLPVTYNHFLQGGFINMPSGRMGQEGEVGIGYSSVPPYRNYNLRLQLIDRLEVSGNYRIFKGIKDPILSPLGFGDLSDKGANIKFSLFLPEDSDYLLPGVAIGYEDFMGTKNFTARYIVLTQVFLKQNLEVSLGYGDHRIRGFFGGFNWMPFRKSGHRYLEGITFTAEYDATPYKDPAIEKHPKGRKSRSPVNFGIKYRLWDHLDLSVSCIRGRALAFSASTFYNFGMTKGLVPKVNDPLPYQAPMNVEAIGWRRPEEVLVQELAYAFFAQGIELQDVLLGYDECRGKTLRLRIWNLTYYLERELRLRINHLLAALIPIDIDQVIVVVDSEGLPVQEYHYQMEYVRAYVAHQMSAFELRVLTPLREVSFVEPGSMRTLFRKRIEWLNIEIFPKVQSFFGSARGKFKYSLGLTLGINGFIYDDLYYSIRLGYIAFSDLHHLTGIDRLNPSQLLNVRTDIVRYYRQKGVTVDEAYLQKCWNLGRGWYTRFALGLFEEEYGGIANEWLYYPVNAKFAIGVEGALLKKRKYSGIGFTSRIRQLHGFIPVYRKHFTGSQYFLNLYYDWQEACLDFKIKGGKFLANDYGARFEIARYFPSGMRVSVWLTLTDGKDKINGSRYYDKGVYISFPLDIIYTRSDRSRWGYGMSAWLRDVGVTAETGNCLYDMIREQRNQ